MHDEIKETVHEVLNDNLIAVKLFEQDGKGTTKVLLQEQLGEVSGVIATILTRSLAVGV